MWVPWHGISKDIGYCTFLETAHRRLQSGVCSPYLISFARIRAFQQFIVSHHRTFLLHKTFTLMYYVYGAVTMVRKMELQFLEVA